MKACGLLPSNATQMSLRSISTTPDEDITLAFQQNVQWVLSHCSRWEIQRMEHVH